MTVIFPRFRRLAGALSALGLCLTIPARAADLSWKGFDWNITDGGMAGVADGDASNVSVDANGWLHLKISKNGDTWTASELFTAQKLGFGTYQWQIEGPIDTFDKNNVLGLFPYGPAAGIGSDGTNEIDIEFSRWGIADAPNADFTDYPASGSVIGETTFSFSLGGTTSATARFSWNDTSIESSVLKGHQAMASETGLLKKWKYAPNNPSVNIPQQALPLGINLWCFGAPPSDGKNVEIVIRDFQFVKEGDPLPGGGGSGVGGSGGMGNGGSGGVAHGGANSAGSGGVAHGGTANGGSAGADAHGGASAGAGGSAGGAASAGNGNGEPTNGGAPSTAGSATGGTVNPGGSGSTTPANGGGSANGGANDADTAPDSSSGCACRAAGTQPRGGQSALLGLTLLAALRRRSQPARLRP